MTTSVVRTRFAPSPTGYLHIGGARTALFAYLFARKHNGKFILRVEDTDRERSTEDSIQAILDGMNWLGLEYDEGPFYQTERIARYRQVADQLLRENKAYRCTCTKERIEALRETQMSNKEKPRYDGHCRDKNIPASSTEPFVLRFKNPEEGAIHFCDLVYGDITVDLKELDDLIIFRTDGMPTYNFAVVIDDHDMEITHVIRGDDHINNTPRQIVLYQALSWDIPLFAHLPMILGDDGKRLSKRHGAVSVLEYRHLGYLPQSVLNYIVRLGWAHGDQEIFSMEEMIAYFDLKKVSRGSSAFNTEKLKWINQHYLKHDDIHALSKEIHWHFTHAAIDLSKGPELATLLSAIAERCKTLHDLVDMARCYYQPLTGYEPESCEQFFTKDAQPILESVLRELEGLDSWDAEGINALIKSLMGTLNLKMPQIAQPIRIALTGTTHSPSIGQTLVLMGRDRTLKRICEGIAWIEGQ